jgi:hypothetical protein
MAENSSGGMLGDGCHNHVPDCNGLAVEQLDLGKCGVFGIEALAPGAQVQRLQGWGGFTSDESASDKTTLAW